MGGCCSGPGSDTQDTLTPCPGTHQRSRCGHAQRRKPRATSLRRTPEHTRPRPPGLVPLAFCDERDVHDQVVVQRALQRRGAGGRGFRRPGPRQRPRGQGPRLPSASGSLRGPAASTSCSPRPTDHLRVRTEYRTPGGGGRGAYIPPQPARPACSSEQRVREFGEWEPISIISLRREEKGAKNKNPTFPFSVKK